MGKKQRISVLLAVTFLSMVVFTMPAFAEEGKELFPDLNGHWAAEQCYVMHDLGIFGGYPDNTFRPNNNITRAEFIAIVVRALDLPPAPPETTFSYEDVKPGNWFYGVVRQAYSAGILKGYGSRFEPNRPITRGEIAKIIVLAVKDTANPKNKEPKQFTDVAPDNPFAEYIYKASMLEIVGGYPDGSFGPNKTATRAEASVMVERAMLAENAPEALPSDETFIEAIKKYADNWAFLRFSFAPDKVEEYLQDYALPSVVQWHKEEILKALGEDEPLPGVFGRVEPGTLVVKINEKYRTLAITEAQFVAQVIYRDSNGKETEGLAIQMDEVLVLKRTGNKWKVGIIDIKQMNQIR